ncbi:hypothetical protein [Halalkalibacter krulwichiae]|uniref:Uncharacterized protein n=1 Tax=Halalkalibacter krulwichiae TaxID=199441 RepID=A0A1X9MJC5_9BACI|nr:hypothetical protein [Halalkalibacter krulwichiae]ARK30702.1 hypothetical protein BkAM31D_13150 [Halalkalibacter krulwichiae]
MVTVIYLTILVSMLFSMAIFDAIIFEKFIIESIKEVYPFELGTRRTIVTVWAVIGLFAAVITDYQSYKKKQNLKTRPTEK